MDQQSEGEAGMGSAQFCAFDSEFISSGGQLVMMSTGSVSSGRNGAATTTTSSSSSSSLSLTPSTGLTPAGNISLASRSGGGPGGGGGNSFSPKARPVPTKEQLPLSIADGRYILQKILGKGNFGTVFRAECTVDGSQVAVKCFHANSSAEVMEEAFSLLMAPAHPNIISVLDVRVNENFVVTELCSDGTLTELQQQFPGGRLPQQMVQQVAVSLLSAIDAIQSHADHAHRDLKLDNILVHRESSSATDVDRVYKIADLGLMTPARTASDEMGPLPFAGTVAFAAPEALAGNATVSSDLWSLGCILMCLLSGAAPWSQMCPENTPRRKFIIDSLQDSTNQPIPFDFQRSLEEQVELSADGKSFLQILFSWSPSERASPSQLLFHPWLASVFSSTPKPAPFRGRIDSSSPEMSNPVWWSTKARAMGDSDRVVVVSAVVGSKTNDDDDGGDGGGGGKEESYDRVQCLLRAARLSSMNGGGSNAALLWKLLGHSMFRLRRSEEDGITTPLCYAHAIISSNYSDADAFVLLGLSLLPQARVSERGGPQHEHEHEYNQQQQQHQQQQVDDDRIDTLLREFASPFKCMQQALELQPTNANAWNGFGCLLVGQDTVKAYQAIRRATKLSRMCSAAWKNLMCVAQILQQEQHQHQHQQDSMGLGTLSSVPSFFTAAVHRQQSSLMLSSSGTNGYDEQQQGGANSSSSSDNDDNQVEFDSDGDRDLERAASDLSDNLSTCNSGGGSSSTFASEGGAVATATSGIGSVVGTNSAVAAANNASSQIAVTCARYATALDPLGSSAAWRTRGDDYSARASATTSRRDARRLRAKALHCYRRLYEKPTVENYSVACCLPSSKMITHTRRFFRHLEISIMNPFNSFPLLPEFARGNIDLIERAVRHDPSAILHLPSSTLKTDSDFLLKHGVRKSAMVMSFVPDALRNDKIFVRRAVGSNAPCILYTPLFEKLSSSSSSTSSSPSSSSSNNNNSSSSSSDGETIDFLLQLVVENSAVLHYLPPSILGNREFAKRVVRQVPNGLARFSDAVRDDEEVVGIAVREGGSMILQKFASERLQTQLVALGREADETRLARALERIDQAKLRDQLPEKEMKEVLLDVIRRVGTEIWDRPGCIPENLQMDRKFQIEAVKRCAGLAPKIFSAAKLADRHSVLDLVKLSGGVLHHVAPALRNDRSFLLDCCYVNGGSVGDAISVLAARGDASQYGGFVRQCIVRSGIGLRAVAPSLRTRELCLIACESSSFAIVWAPDTVRLDSSFVRTVCRRNPRVLPLVGRDLDREELEAIVMFQPSAVLYLPKSMQRDKQFISRVCAKNAAVLSFLVPELRNDAEFVRELLEVAGGEAAKMFLV